MRFILSIALAAFVTAGRRLVRQSGGLAIPLSKRSTLVNPDKSISPDGLKSYDESVEANIRRFGKRENSLSLKDDYLWYGSIEVGSNHQRFNVAFDTGSSDLFLPVIYGDDSCKKNHNVYDPAPSESAKILYEPSAITYKDGSSVSGSLYNETIYIADFTVTKQTFLAAKICSKEFQAHNFIPDGMMGMGFRSMSAYEASPVFESLVDQEALPEKAFSFKLSEPGELYLGGSNTKLYDPDTDFAFATLINEDLWEVSMDNIEINGYLVPDVEEVPAVIDTGTPLIYGPISQVTELYRDVQGMKNIGSGIYTFPCDSPPSISFTFSGTTFPIPGSSLKAKLETITTPPDECASAIVASDDPDQDHRLIGIAFLENWYVRFDYDGPDHEPQVGFAPLNQETVSQPGSSTSTSAAT